MRPVAFGEDLPPGTGLPLFSGDKPARFFTVIKFWMDETSGVALAPKTGVPSYQVEDGLPRRRSASVGLRRDKLCRRREEGRIHFLIDLPIEDTSETIWSANHSSVLIVDASGRRDTISIKSGSRQLRLFCGNYGDALDAWKPRRREVRHPMSCKP